MTPRIVLASLAVTLLLFSASVAHAQQKAPDGTILISQSTVIGGLPGDANGFPITIARSGSYRLTSNIVVPDATPAIVIAASNVTLDLNGFSILGPGTFPTGPAIIGDGQSRVRISNGIISGYGNGIRFAGASEFITLERLHIDATSVFGTQQIAGVAILAGETKVARALIRDVVGQGQIQVTCPSLVLDTVGAVVVELNVPDNGIGNIFPTKCAGENVLQF